MITSISPVIVQVKDKANPRLDQGINLFTNGHKAGMHGLQGHWWYCLPRNRSLYALFGSKERAGEPARQEICHVRWCRYDNDFSRHGNLTKTYPGFLLAGLNHLFSPTRPTVLVTKSKVN